MGIMRHLTGLQKAPYSDLRLFRCRAGGRISSEGVSYGNLRKPSRSLSAAGIKPGMAGSLLNVRNHVLNCQDIVIVL